jgi:hypothetical protein
LGQDTVDRCRRIIGPDHSITLLGAATLTAALIRFNEPATARRWGQDTVDRCRRIIGPDHPITLFAAVALTAARAEPGEPAVARSQWAFERVVIRA